MSAGHSLATQGTGFIRPPQHADGPACPGPLQRPSATRHPEHGPEFPDCLPRLRTRPCPGSSSPCSGLVHGSSCPATVALLGVLVSASSGVRFKFSFMAGLILQPYWTRDLWDHGMVGLQHGSTTGRKSSSSGSGLVLASSCRPWLAQAPPAIHMQGRAMHSSHDLHSHPLAGHHSSITPGTLNGPGLPAANTRSPDTAPPYQTAGPTPCRVAPPRSQRSPGRTARTGLAVSRSCPTEHGRLGALPHAACPCSNPTLATTQTRPTSL